MEQEGKALRNLVLLGIFFILGSLLVSYWKYQPYAPPELETPQIVTDLFESHIRKTHTEGPPEVDYSMFFTEVKLLEGDEGSLEESAFGDTLYTLDRGFDTVQFYPITEEFIIVRLFKANQLTSPPIGFWYTLKNDKIEHWRLGRLLPFSKYDPEYFDDWGQLYGL